MILDRQRIELAQARAGLSVADIASRTGRNYQAAAQMLWRAKGGCEIRPTSAKVLADALGCEVDDLIAGVGGTRTCRNA